MSESGPSEAAPPVRRVIVLGPPGSGKSTLARQLGEHYGLPVFHLDRIHFRPGWVPVEPDTFQAEVARIAALPAWVIDGNYTATIAPRLARADTVIYLDVPTWLALARIIKRTIMSNGRERPEMAAGCPERFELEFLRFALAWNRTRRARSLAIAEDFAGRGIVLRSRRPMHDLSRLLDRRA